MSTSPLESLRADDIAKYLAERNSRVYSLEQVAEMTGFSLRALQKKCRAGTVKHVHDGRNRGMTLRQIDLLVNCFETGETDQSSATSLDDVEEARILSRQASRPSRGRRAA